MAPQLLQVNGNFDNCLEVARKLAEAYPVFLVNSVNPARIEGQKTAAFEVVDYLGDAPDYHLLPVGNAGNITAYWRGYQEYAAPYDQPGRHELAPVATKTPVMWGFQAEGASPAGQGPPGHAIRTPSPRPSASATRRPGTRRSPPATSPAD